MQRGQAGSRIVELEDETAMIAAAPGQGCLVEPRGIPTP